MAYEGLADGDVFSPARPRVHTANPIPIAGVEDKWNRQYSELASRHATPSNVVFTVPVTAQAQSMTL